MNRSSPAPDPALPRRVLRSTRPAGTRVVVGSVEVGGPAFVVAAGPCAVETPAQLAEAAAAVAGAGAHLLRGGVFKPRTSPYAFQGLGEPGLVLLERARARHGLGVVAEVLDTEQLASLIDHVDMLQVGARNMQNFPLLRALGKVRRPVLLKRGLAATFQEWLLAAEYLLDGGNEQVILCERGIRTFEPATRNTLDLASVALAKARTCRCLSTRATPPATASSSSPWPWPPRRQEPMDCWWRCTPRPTRPSAMARRPSPLRSSRSSCGGFCPSSVRWGAPCTPGRPRRPA